MNALFKAFLEREIKSIFGDLCTSIYLSDSKHESIIVLANNLDKTRPKGKELGSVAISMSNLELEGAKYPLELFKIRAENARKTMAEHLKEVA